LARLNAITPLIFFTYDAPSWERAQGRFLATERIRESELHIYVFGKIILRKREYYEAISLQTMLTASIAAWICSNSGVVLKPSAPEGADVGLATNRPVTGPGWMRG